MDLSFEWDPIKAAGNIAKHKVAFEEAATVFGDPLGRVVPDTRLSVGEERFAILGRSARDRLIVVVFAERGETIRIISARKATGRERRAYEAGK